LLAIHFLLKIPGGGVLHYILLRKHSLGVHFQNLNSRSDCLSSSGHNVPIIAQAQLNRVLQVVVFRQRKT